MFLGTSPILYGFLTGLTTIAFVFLGLGDFLATGEYLQIRAWGKDDTKVVSTAKRYTTPLYVSAGLVALVIACASEWVVQLGTADAISGVNYTAAWNHKVTYLMTRMFLFAPAILFDWFNHTNFFNREDEQKRITANANMAFTSYIISAMVLVIYLSMLIACQIVFNSDMSNPGSTQTLQYTWNTNTTDCIIAAIALLFAPLIFDVGRKIYHFRDFQDKEHYGTLTTETSRIIRRLKDEGAMTIPLDKVNLATDLKKFENSSIPLTFIPTGGKTFAKDVHEHALIHHVENKIKAMQNPPVSLKNYAIVHNKTANELLVLNDDEAHQLYQLVPGGELNYAKYGFLGSVANKAAEKAEEEIQFVENDFEGSKGQKIQKILELRNTKIQNMGLKLFGDLYETEPPVLRYNMHIMGFAVGNGTWYNYPVWMAFCITMITLAADINIWGDGAAGLIDWLVCAFCPFFFSSLAYEGGWYQLFIYFQAIGTALIVVQHWFTYSGSTQYLMDSTIVYSNSSVWVQNSSYANTNVFDVQVPSYFAITLVCIFVTGHLFALFKSIKPSDYKTVP